MAKEIWQGSNGPNGNDWNVGSNWNTGIVPQPGDDVEVPTGTPLVDLKGATATVASVTVDNGASADLTGQLTVTGDLVDNGGASVDTSFLVEFGGSNLTVGGTLTATNSGAGFSIGNRAQTSNTTVTANAVTDTGTINIAGNATGGSARLNVMSAAGFGGMAGVLTGNINLGIGVGGAGGPGDALLDFLGGGLINTIQGGTVQLHGALAFIASGAATTSNSALTGPLTIAATGGLILQTGAAVTTQALTVAGNVSVDTDFLGIGDSKLTVSNLLSVSGGLTIGRSALDVSSTTAGTVTAGSLANSGSISLNGDTTSKIQGALNVGAAAGFGTAGVLTGNVSLTGFSLLDFASGGITSIDRTGSLTIDGTRAFFASGSATSSNSALTGLAEVDGSFTLVDGAALTTNNGLGVANGVNFAHMNVDNSGTGGSTLHIGGTLTLNSFGGATIGNGSITAATTVTANALNFVGTANAGLNLIGAATAGSGTAQSTLTVASAAGFGTAGVLSGGDLDLTGKTLLDFTLGGQITTAAFGANVVIDGANAFVASGNATSSNSALTGLTTVGDSFALHDGASIATGGGLTVGDGTHGANLNVDTGSALTVGGTLGTTAAGNFSLDAGNAGGSKLTVTGSLSNAGGLVFGNKNITTSTTASAAGLANNGGNITIVGASKTNTATLSLSAKASNFGGSVVINPFGVLSEGANVYEQVNGNTMIAGTLDASSVNIAGGTVELAVGGVVTGGIGFVFTSGQLKIDGSVMPSNTISNFLPGNTIDLASVAFDPSGTAKMTAGNVLQISENGSTYNLNLNPVADPAGTLSYALSDDKSGGTLVALVCFCRGTRVLAERGEVPVEELAVGDRVKTLSGELKPIVWIGVGRDLVTRANKLARPVIVRQGALADGVPARDLYLTHGHALYLDGVLIPVEHLVNHRSILWDEAARVVEYYHIELEDHDAVFAEGAPAETYYDAGNRALFHNAKPGSATGAVKAPFAPVVNGGEAAARVWQRLFSRAGGRIIDSTTEDPDLHLIADGARLDPAAVDGCTYTFALDAPPAAPLRLCSRSGVPSLLGISPHDHRWLGVAITQIVLRHAGIATYFDYDQPQLREAGCHAPEEGFCWTDGELLLPIRFYTGLDGALALTVHIERAGMRYPLPAAIAAAA